MKVFTVEEKVFERVPDYCLGIVIADGIDNWEAQPTICGRFEYDYE